MRNALITLTFILTVIAGLGLLVFVSSCATTDSFETGGKMTAMQQIFHSTTNIVETPFFISRDARKSGRPDDAKISEIKDDSGLLGYCVESKVISRSGPFRIRVLLDKQLHVREVSVISYPWDRGRDVRKRAFTDQFKGKGPEDPIQLGKDIDAMTGATISSRAMTEGIRDTIKLLKLVKEKEIEKQTGKSKSQNRQGQYTEVLACPYFMYQLL